jgi:hypothetical protein
MWIPFSPSLRTSRSRNSDLSHTLATSVITYLAIKTALLRLAKDFRRLPRLAVDDGCHGTRQPPGLLAQSHVRLFPDDPPRAVLPELAEDIVDRRERRNRRGAGSAKGNRCEKNWWGRLCTNERCDG